MTLSLNHGQITLVQKGLIETGIIKHCSERKLLTSITRDVAVRASCMLGMLPRRQNLHICILFWFEELFETALEAPKTDPRGLEMVHMSPKMAPKGRREALIVSEDLLKDFEVLRLRRHARICTRTYTDVNAVLVEELFGLWP